MSREPVTTLDDLDDLDPEEVIAGYWDGYDGEPEPGDNRSRAYWHGWRNGAVDGKHREKDDAQAELARVWHARAIDAAPRKPASPCTDGGDRDRRSRVASQNP